MVNFDEMSDKTLTLIIPAYNEAHRIRHTIRKARWYFDRKGIPAALIVVDDGSTDGTADLVEAMTAEVDGLSLIRIAPNRGKGYAVRTGVSAADSDVVLFSDADLATPLIETGKLLAALADGCDVAIGSRTGVTDPDTTVKRRSVMRRVTSFVFNRAVRFLTGLKAGDTQCGFKMFTREAAREIFGRMQIDGFAFDVEALYLAKKLGLRVGEVSVNWFHGADTRVSAARDGGKMLADVRAIVKMHEGVRSLR